MTTSQLTTMASDISLGWQALAFSLLHPSLWKRVIAWVVVLLIAVLAFTVLLFVQTFHSQVNFVADFLYSGLNWLAWPIGLILFAGETSLLAIVLYTIIFPQSKSHLVQATWKLKGATTLLHLSKTATGQPLRTELGTALVFLLAQLLLAIVTLPLHTLPGVGQVLYSVVNGFLLAWDLLRPWMAARNLHLRQQLRVMGQQSHRLALFGLGVHAIMLIPGLNIISVFSSPVAGALFALELDNDLYS